MTDMAIAIYGSSFFVGLFCIIFGGMGFDIAKTSIGKLFAKSSYIIGMTMFLTLAIKLFIALVMI